METYLTFNVGQPCTVSSVKLELFGGLSGKPDNVQVSAYAVSNTTWTETGLTWNNKPPAGSLLRTTTVVNSTTGWYEWDITSYVQSEIAAGRGVISIVLRNPTTTSNQVIFNSREATTNKPKLVVVTP
jgi:endoglucanase